MGHIINPVSLRLGLNKEWPLRVSTYKIESHLERYLKEYVSSIFDNRLLRDWGFIFSHLMLEQANDRVIVHVFLYDGISESVLAVLLRAIQRRFYIQRNLSRKKWLRRKIRGAKRLRSNDFIDSSGVFSYINKEFANNKFVLVGLNEVLDRYFIFRNALNFRIRQYFYDLLQELLLIDLSYVFKEYKNKLHINISYIYSSRLTAQVLGKYITRKLEYRYSLSEIITPLMKGFEDIVLGFFVRCSGRFTRAQRAQRKDFRLGLSPQSTLALGFEHAFGVSKLKYGVCGIKVWIVSHEYY